MQLLTRVLFILIITVYGQRSFGQNAYYISLAGNDSFEGTSPARPWKTIQKATAAIHNGDRIFLRRGDVFTGRLKISANNVTVNAYGNGSKPVITGERRLNGSWTVWKNNIWMLKTGYTGQITGLYKEHVPQPISRYPDINVNNGYLNFESHEGNIKIFDHELNGDIDWTGSEIVIRAELFRLVRTTVLRQTGNSIEIAPNKSIARFRDGFGYFFVNNIKAISTEGEWAFNKATGELFVYASANPNRYAYSIPATDTLVSIEDASGVAINNIKITMAGKLGIAVNSSSNITIDGVEITNSGGDGAIFDGSENVQFQNAVVADVNWSGIYSTTSSKNLLFKNNIIKNIGNAAFGKSKTFIGIDCNSPASRILNNQITNTGYAGIICCGRNNLVQRNFVEAACKLLEDNGGIYTNNNINNTSGTIIENNIVTHISCLQGGSKGEISLANGIYLDNRSQGVTVRNNTVAFIDGSGLFIHSTLRNNKVLNNTSFQSGYSEMYITNPDTIPDYEICGNILASTNPDEKHVVLLTGKTDKYTLAQIGVFKDNYLINPLNVKPVKIVYNDGNAAQTRRLFVAEWQQLAGANAVGNAAIQTGGNNSAGAIRFIMNRNDKAQRFVLDDGIYITPQGKRYSGTVSLPPYTSLVLYKQVDK